MPLVDVLLLDSLMSYCFAESQCSRHILLFSSRCRIEAVLRGPDQWNW